MIWTPDRYADLKARAVENGVPTYSALADKIGVKKGTLCNWIKGRRSPSPLAKLRLETLYREWSDMSQLRFIPAPLPPSPAPLRLVGHWEKDGKTLARVECSQGLYFLTGELVKDLGGDYFGERIDATDDAEAVLRARRVIIGLIQKKVAALNATFADFLGCALPGQAAITGITGKFLPLAALAFPELPSGHAQPIPRTDYREGAAEELIPAKCCPMCDDGDGNCAFPYVGVAPHTSWSDDGKLETGYLPQSEWPSNYRHDESSKNEGEYTHCLHCGCGEKPALTFTGDDSELLAKLNESARLHAAGLSADEQPTAELLQCEVDAALNAEVAKRAAEEMEPIAAEFEAPKCGKCNGEGFVTIAAGYIGQGKRLTCPVCHGSKLAPPADHQPRPIRTQAEREVADAKAHHFSTLARRSKAAKRAKQDGTHHQQETGGEG